MRPMRILMWLGLAAVTGIASFGVMAWRAVEVRHAEASEAAQRFQMARSAFDDRPALLSRSDSGELTRRRDAAPVDPRPITHLYVLTYLAGSERLIDADIPFWFFKMKAPALRFMLRSSTALLDELNLSAADLERQGPTLIFDGADGDGSRVLVWTE